MRDEPADSQTEQNSGWDPCAGKTQSQSDRAPSHEMVMLRDPIRWSTVISATVVVQLLVPVHDLPTLLARRMRLLACVGASMSFGNRTAGVAGEVYLCECPPDPGRREKVYQFFLHLVGVFFAADVSNSLQIRRMAAGKDEWESHIYTDRRANSRIFCNCMAYYVGNFWRLCNSRIRVSHAPRYDA